MTSTLELIRASRDLSAAISEQRSIQRNALTESDAQEVALDVARLAERLLKMTGRRTYHWDQVRTFALHDHGRVAHELKFGAPGNVN